MCLHENLKIDGEDMELAAIYHFCNKYDINFVSIKGISNNEINGETYDDSVNFPLIKFVKQVIPVL